MCPTSLAASASARGGSESESGAEAGGGEACLEMRKVRRGCIVDGGSGSRALEVSIPKLYYRSSAFTKHEEIGGKKGTYEL